MFRKTWRRAQRWVARRAALPAVIRDDGGRLPPRLSGKAWGFGVLAFLLSYGWLFTYVHVRADTQACLLRLDDPLYRIIPLNLHWDILNWGIYMALTAMCTIAMLLQAALGDHRPIVRFGSGLAIMGLLRGLCILLVPLCRVNSEPGSVVFTQVPTLDLFGLHIPFRAWAKNDMLFSGHVGEFLLLIRLTKSWPRLARGVLVVFFCLQLFGLLSTRAHYTVDIILAIPCAYFADRMAVHILALLSPSRLPSARAALDLSSKP